MNRPQPCLRRFAAAACLAGMATLSACASAPAVPASPAPADQAAVQDSLGIALHGLHLTAHGSMLDLRYRVTDPAKAAVLLDPKKKVQLLDPRRHAALGVPESPVIGPMRQTARNHVLYQDRDYFVLFVNPGHAVKAGETVQLAVDGQPLARLQVE